MSNKVIRKICYSCDRHKNNKCSRIIGSICYTSGNTRFVPAKGLPDENGWIKVSEDKPEYMRMLQYVYSDRDNLYRSVGVRQKKNDRWQDHIAGNLLSDKVVIYWQYLPELPEK